MKNVLLAPVSPPVDLARGRETQIGPILAHFGHFGTFGLSGALLLDPENQRNGESYLLISLRRVTQHHLPHLLLREHICLIPPPPHRDPLLGDEQI